jgi:NAD(P)-dependent dehydrogenase (short-subunit alcohol dehydrogenase family)
MNDGTTLEGKAVLITGANGGIGEALVAEALRRGVGHRLANAHLSGAPPRAGDAHSLGRSKSPCPRRRGLDRVLPGDSAASSP